MVNILLYISEQCKRYYPASEIPAMLTAFFPLLTKDVRLFPKIAPQVGFLDLQDQLSL